MVQTLVQSCHQFLTVGLFPFLNHLHVLSQRLIDQSHPIPKNIKYIIYENNKIPMMLLKLFNSKVAYFTTDMPSNHYSPNETVHAFLYLQLCFPNHQRAKE